VGRRLATLICQLAKDASYTHIRLDTLSDMQSARQLYASLGFQPIAPYVFNPIPGAIFLECELTAARWSTDSRDQV
jgi:ribosomal protein S18 acetylase RimI-like enzyme